MTTIAWDGTMLASDTLSTSGNMKLSGECIKTRRVGKYRIAFAGEYAPAIIFYKEYMVDHLEMETMTYDPIGPSEADFTIMVIEDDKNTCMVFNSHSGYWDEFNPPISIGSGSKYAMGSMYSGNDAHKAVEVSCKLDTHSSFPIRVEK